MIFLLLTNYWGKIWPQVRKRSRDLTPLLMTLSCQMWTEKSSMLLWRRILLLDCSHRIMRWQLRWWQRRGNCSWSERLCSKDCLKAFEAVHGFCRQRNFDSNVHASLKQVENLLMFESSEVIMQQKHAVLDESNVARVKWVLNAVLAAWQQSLQGESVIPTMLDKTQHHEWLCDSSYWCSAAAGGFRLNSVLDLTIHLGVTEHIVKSRTDCIPLPKV